MFAIFLIIDKVSDNSLMNECLDLEQFSQLLVSMRISESERTHFFDDNYECRYETERLLCDMSFRDKNNIDFVDIKAEKGQFGVPRET